jgi:hypothetical protein
MASLRTSALAAACMLLFVLSLCEASRAIPQLHGLAILGANGSVAVDITGAQSASGALKSEPAAQVTPRALLEGDCRTSDIIIEQFEVSGVGLPTFQVRFTNTCTNPRCSISFLIVNCGQFHTGDILVNPKVFRRLDVAQGTCIVNDGQQIRNADTITFQYREIWKQTITFRSARVFCHA